MTSYTDNRGYPYPSSAREAGNGGAASEALARAIARDLDTVDAGWALQATRPTKILGLAANITNFVNGVRQVVNFSQVNKIVQPSYFTTSTTEIRVLADGWYRALLNFRGAPSGTVTVNARMENWLNHYRSDASGTLRHVEPSGERFGETYWPSTTPDLFNEVSGVFRMISGDRIWAELQHGNTGSNINIVASGTYLTVVRLAGI